jgi:hypothetical protein
MVDQPIFENLVFGDIWRKRYRAQIVDIEEGVLSKWHFGRTVLVGDAAHKVGEATVVSPLAEDLCLCPT